MSSSNLSFVNLAPAGPVPLDQVAVRLNPRDDVAIAKVSMPAGTQLIVGGAAIDVNQLIPEGHKVALRAIPVDQPLRRYGQIIGFASRPIAAGEHVHTHNLGIRNFERDYAYSVDALPVQYVPEAHRRAFQGFKRHDGRVGTRNFIAVISTVNCSAFTSKQIARHFTPDVLAAFPNVDGVIPITHGWGCAMKIGGENYELLQRTLAGFANHANVGGYVLVGLGCEGNQVEELIDVQHLVDAHGDRPLRMTIQESGGIRATVRRGIEAVERLLPLVNATGRTPQPVSELMLALECGGSDTWSGVTANPVLGLVSDMLVQQGGTTCLAETTEIYGAEHLLTRRAVNRDVGEKLVALVHWWEAYAAKMGVEIDNNPSPGNKAGGLTNIYEKSLGAVAKGGSMPLAGVYQYAEPITTRGFVFMDTPGYDPIEATGQVAGGCNLLAFTTGRGSAFGFKPAPSIKICTNSTTYARQEDDMDLNAGKVLDGVPLQVVAEELFDLMVEVASGRKTKSEELGVGEDEFQPWNIGGTV